MSRATDYLLSRNGRDQYGNRGKGVVRLPAVERDETKVKNEIELYHRLNEEFFEKFGSIWSLDYKGLSKKEIWKKLYLNGKPSLSSFYKEVRSYKKEDEILKFLCLSNKARVLASLGYERSKSLEILKPFQAIRTSIQPRV